MTERKTDMDPSGGNLVLEPLAPELSICKLQSLAGVDLDRPLCFFCRTDTERSLVCPTELTPDAATHREDGWRAFRVAGTLEFSLIGILAGITRVLAEQGIGVFVVSTFDTDYVLTRAERFSEALRALAAAGYCIRSQAETPGE